MIQNLGSKPHISCKIVIDIVIIINFLYLSIIFFIKNSNPFNVSKYNKFDIKSCFIIIIWLIFF